MSRADSRYLYLLVFIVGVVSLGAEIAVARLIAPFFGASTVIWANTIGVVLTVLALGYWFGGRLADRRPEWRVLCLICLAAASILAAVPFVAQPFLSTSATALGALDAGAFIGSLLAVSVLIAVPVFMLGMVAPFAVRLATGDVTETGTVTGRLYAISTFGSLVGTFLAALFLIPTVGTRRTFLTFALLLALIALPKLKHRYWVLLPILAATLLLPVNTIKPAGSGKVLFEQETPYQYLRVVEDGSTRYLELNEGQAVHSMYRRGSYLTDNVWDSYLVLPFAALKKPPQRVAILGNGAGTTARAFGHFFPQARVDGVEIDGKLTQVGRRYFGLRNPRLRVFHEDARPFLRRTEDRYDLIAVDAYRQPYIPFYLTTREFFSEVQARLKPGGAVVINVGHPEGELELERVLAVTVGSVFTNVLRSPAEVSNTLLLATDAGAGNQLLIDNIKRLPKALRPRATEAARTLQNPLTGGTVYTDDRAPVEWLIDKSIVSYALRK